MSVVCVLGATGAQGGSVCQVLLKNPKWKVRAITRNANSNAAKKLAAQGIEVVSGDADDEASLVKAFEGAKAIFALTNYDWAHVNALGQDKAGEIEERQSINISRAVSKTPTVEHYIMSTLPPASDVSGGRLKVPHFDYKQRAFKWLHSNLPELAKKTTQLWVGWYTSNLVNVPALRLIPVHDSGSYLAAQPSKPDAILASAGDVQNNTGVMVEGILEAGPKTYERVATVITEYITFADVIKLWEKVTGKPAAYVEISKEANSKIRGVAGDEFAAQYMWSEEFPYWHTIPGDKYISAEELGVKDRLIDTETSLNTMRSQLY